MFSLLLVFMAFNVQAKEGGEEKGGINVKDSVQIQTTNQGEESEIQVQNREENRVETNAQVKTQGEDDDSDENEYGNRKNDDSDDDLDDEDNGKNMGEERRSMVANAVQEMLQVADRTGGIGEQVRVIAQNQVMHQEALEESLEEARDRSGFAKFFIGPKYNKINESKKLLEQNKERVTELNQIHAQILNEADAQNLMEQISLLEQANLQIEATINSSEKTFSLLGWFSKMFVKK